MKTVVRNSKGEIQNHYLCHINGFPAYGSEEEVYFIINTIIDEEMVKKIDNHTFKMLTIDLINNIIHEYEFKYRIFKILEYDLKLYFDIDSVVERMKKMIR